MRQFSFIISLLFAITAGAQQPNILLIIADDLGLDPVPNYLPGPQKAAMPNLEALMANGITFDNVWADPLCSPTRSTIITGRYGHRTGVLNANAESQLPPNETTLHRYLTYAGSPYATSIIGKWHLSGQVPNPGYPNFMGIPYYAGLLAGAVSDYYAWDLTVNAIQNPRTDYITTAITDLSIDWIGQQTSPWFCWLAYTAPHVPFHLPPLNMHTQGALPTDLASINANPLPYYLAMVESLDYEVGRLLASLPAGQLANTVIIFIGDNGTDRNVIQFPHAMNHGKGTLSQGGVHVPMVVSGPGVTRQGEREDGLINSTDLFTTIVELTGLALPAYEDSRSLVPMFSTPGLSVRECLYTEVEDMTNGHAIRNVRYKLISFANGTEEFYDLVLDPYEQSALPIGSLTTQQQDAYNDLVSSCDPFLAITDLAGPAYSLGPDPASEELHIRRTTNRPADHVIRTITGQLVSTGRVNDGNAIINVAGLRPGIYILELDGWRERFVKL